MKRSRIGYELTALLIGLVFSLICLVTNPPVAVGQEEYDSDESLAPYVPSAVEVVDKMLEMAQVTSKDIVYDLGCGDGRIVITAAKRFGAKGVGVELNEGRAKLATENAKKENVQHLVTILHQDAMKVDISSATVIAVYLLPEAMRKLRPIFEASLKPGTRIVSHDYDVEGWTPDRVEQVGADNTFNHTIYMWTIKDQNKEKANKKK